MNYINSKIKDKFYKFSFFIGFDQTKNKYLISYCFDTIYFSPKEERHTTVNAFHHFSRVPSCNEITEFAQVTMKSIGLLSRTRITSRSNRHIIIIIVYTAFYFHAVHTIFPFVFEFL